MTANSLEEVIPPIVETTPNTIVDTAHRLRASRITATRGQRVIVAADVAVGAGLVIAVELDGTPVWQLLRLAVVAALTAATRSALQHGDLHRRAGVALQLASSVLPSVPGSRCATSPRAESIC